jgi:hypothetical protein
LLANKKRLESREKGKMRGSQWYGYIYLKNMARQSIKKLCVPRLVDHLYAAYDIDGNHFLDNVDVGGIILKQDYLSQGYLYILGLLNSKLLRWYFPYVSAPFRGGWISANRQFLAQLPIFVINFASTAEVNNHSYIIALVELMISLHKQLAAALTPTDKTLFQRQIASTDHQIDTLIYGLYGLSEEEIRVVEGN